MKKNTKLILALMLSAFILSCSNNDSNSVNPENETVNPSDYIYFISGKIDGEPFLYGQRFDDTVLNYQIVSSIPLEAATCAYSNDQGLNLGISYGSSIYPDFDSEDMMPAMNLDFVRFYMCSNSQSYSEAFNGLFTIGTYNFAENDSSSGTTGEVGIIYSPIATGDVHYTSYGQNQTNSVFEITSTESNNTSFTQSQTIEGEFSVMLYNIDDASEVIEITDGKFKIDVNR